MNIAIFFLKCCLINSSWQHTFGADTNVELGDYKYKTVHEWVTVELNVAPVDGNDTDYSLSSMGEPE